MNSKPQKPFRDLRGNHLLDGGIQRTVHPFLFHMLNDRICQIGAMEIGLTKVDTREVCARQICPCQIRTLKLDAPSLAP